MTTKLGVATQDILDQIYLERENQDKKWGPQHHSLEGWYTILGEEVGEVAMAILESWHTNVREELIQVAAVCVAMIEDIDDKNA